jgi:aspartyl/asparaginyl beta-hydroxylase (cupin superfamily)
MEIGMVYDINKFVFKDKIDAAIPKLKEEFLSVHGSSTEGIPLYSEYIGNSLDPKNKWKMLVIKIMGEWEEKNLKTYPALTELVRSFGDVCRSAGYSVLDPGGDVPTHTDTEEGHENYVICHVPLIVPEGDVGFLEGDVKGTWKEGECFLLDVEIPHSVWNHTNKPRVVVLLELLKEVSYAV